MSTTDTTPAMVCIRCGDETDPDPDRDEAGEPLCPGCWYDEHYFECAACGAAEELEHQGGIGDVLVVTQKGCGVSRGVYRVLSWPYYAQPLIGQGLLIPRSLRWLRCKPPTVDDEYPVAHLCRACGAKLTD